MSSDRWPPPPDCERCQAFRSTEVVSEANENTFHVHCRSCNSVILCDRFGQIIQPPVCDGKHVRPSHLDVSGTVIDGPDY